MLSVTVPQEVLFYADSLYGHVGLFDVRSSAIDRADLHLVAYSPRPVGVAYDPLLQVCIQLYVHNCTFNSLTAFSLSRDDICAARVI